MKEWSSGDIEAGDITIHYHRTGGDKPPLVLAHGITDNGRCWQRVAGALQGDFDIVMVDARGHGKSSRIPDDPTTDHVDDLVALIDALGLTKPALMGHSMGGRAVAGVAANHPDRASRIVLEDPPWLDREGAGETGLRTRRETFRQSVEAFSNMSVEEIARLGKASNPSWHEDDFPAWAESKKQVDANVMNHFSLEPWYEVAAKIACPTLLIYADREKGGIVGRDIAEEATRLNSRISSHHIAGAGHNIRRERFDEFVNAVTEFLVA